MRTALLRGIFDIGIFSFAVNVLMLTMPIYLLQVYDRVLPAASEETLLYLSLIAVLSLVFLGLLDIVRSLYSQRLAVTIDRHIASPAFTVALRSEESYSRDIQPLNDLAVLRNFISSRVFITLFDLPFAPIFLIMLFFVHPMLLWIALIGISLLLIVVMVNQTAIRFSGRSGQDKNFYSNLLAQAFIRNADTLKSMGMIKSSIENWGSHFSEALRENGILASINSCFGGISRSLRMILQLAILGMGAFLVLRGEMTAGMIFASSIIAGRALQPLDMLIGGWRQTVEAYNSVSRLREVYRKYKTSRRNSTTLPEPSGAICVADLMYYAPHTKPGSQPILRRLNFRIGAGEAIAIIGPSRAGKSTLLRLLVGAETPSSGAVRYDNAEIATWDSEQLGRHIGYLAQDVQLFPGTISQNIARFDLNANDEQIIEAAKRAHSHELITSQPDGYQTRIGLTGHALSGGEKQRIGLARAFYGNPRILVLDEPNANLDSDGEIALAESLREAKSNGTTIIIVTHRISIARDCDRVMILRNGSIDTFGPAAEVLRKLAGKQADSTAFSTQNLQTSYTVSGALRQHGITQRSVG